MTTEMNATQGLQGPDEFDLLLNDVLRTVANPEMPERVRVNVRTRIWVREMSTSHAAAKTTIVPPAVFQDFQARMNPRRGTASTLWALGVHAAAIVLICWMVAAKQKWVSTVKTVEMTQLTPPPPMAPLKKDVMGGGGGQKSPTPVSKGQLPKFADTQITPPNAPPLQEPKIKMPDPTIEVQKDLRMTNNNMPNMGMPNSPLLGNSLGNGSGTGLGGGAGTGLGSGSGGNYGGGIKKIGGGVSAPELLYKVDPEFSEEARKAKFMGVVTVNLIVDEKGNPVNVRVVRGAGMGLDQKAVDAVKQYKFRAAMEGGKPVAVQLNIEVNFQIF